MDIETYKSICKWSEELDGAFTLSDLRIALTPKQKTLNSNSLSTVYRQIEKLVQSKDLIKIKNSIYAAKNATLASIATRIFPNAYISTGTVLAKYNIIGSIPEKKIQLIDTGKPRIFNSELGTIQALSIKPELFFGFERINGVLIATPEKAYLDTCYYYYKGKKFSFDLDTDINTSLLNIKLINQYLKKYDLRFQTYFKNKFIGNFNENFI